jgi:cholesterol transport system auxiliary component
MKVFYRIASVSVMSVLLAACGLTQPVKVASVSSYTLTRTGKPQARRTPLRKSILVSRPIASPGYRGRAMVYVDKTYQLKHFARNQWVAPPAQLMLPLIAQTLLKAHAFHAVVEPPFAGVTNYRLDTRLVKLQQDFTHNPSRVTVVLQAELINNISNKIIASRSFQTKVNTQHNDPYAGVIATNVAVQRLMTQLGNFVVRRVA